MQTPRYRVLTLVLTIFVGLALASSARAHHLPTGAERVLQRLEAAGVPLAALCGHPQGKPSCPDETCAACPAGFAAPDLTPAMPDPLRIPLQFALALPVDVAPVAIPLLRWHDSQGPPQGLT